MVLHEKNWRVSLLVQELHHPPNFPWILAATLGFQNFTGHPVPSTTCLPSLSVAVFYWFLEFLLAWSTSGLSDLSSTVVDTVTGEMSLSIRSSRSRVLEIACLARDLCHSSQRVAPVYRGSELCFQALKQSDPTNRERESRPISIQRPKRWFRVLLNCAKLKFVSSTSNFLE